MKIFLFLFLSIALHAAALAYPALLLESTTAVPVVVTVVDAAGGERGGGAKGEGSAPVKKPSPPARATAPITSRRQPSAEPERIVEKPKMDAEPAIAADPSGGIAVAAGRAEGAAVVETSSVFSGGGDVNANGRGGSGGGLGVGNGSGSGASSFVTASYDRCPSPDYPEIARERLAGTVVLRVLVDKEGRPKSLEVNKSSGFVVLDEAAVQHIKQRCSFHPARSGEERVESLVELPVEFKLAHLRR